MKTTLITTLGAFAVCGAVLLAQSGRNQQLERKVAFLKTEISDLEERKKGIQLTVRQNSPEKRTGTTIIANPPSSESPTDSPSTDRIAKARKRIDILVADMDSLSSSPAELIRALPDLLRSIEELSLDELITLAEGIGSEGSTTSDTGLGATRMILFLIAAEQDPLRILQNDNVMKDREIQRSIVVAYAKRSPRAALHWLEESEYIDRRQITFYQSAILNQTLQHDIELSLSLLREIHEDKSGRNTYTSIGGGAVPAEVLPKLVNAARDPANEDIRTPLFKMIFTSSLLNGGIKEVKTQFEGFDLSDPALSGPLSANFASAVRSDPEGTLEWAMEIFDAETQPVEIPNLVSSWANNDYNAAGEWLGAMESSLIKDKSIVSFSRTVVRVDPEGAAIWSAQISDPETRKDSLNWVIPQWRAKDEEAANAWLAETGIEINEP